MSPVRIRHGPPAIVDLAQLARAVDLQCPVSLTVKRRLCKSLISVRLRSGAPLFDKFPPARREEPVYASDTVTST